MGHVNIGEAHPDAYRALLALNNQVAADATAAGLGKRLVELVKIRASQLNGCAFCLRMHTADAVAAGETPERLAVLAAWWESQYFDEAEQAALRIAEQVTLLGDRAGVPVRGADPREALTEAQISAVTWLTVVINSWNRVAVASHYPVAPPPPNPGSTM